MVVNGSIAAVPPNRIVRTATGLTAPNDPTQTGTVATCGLWYDVVENDSCSAFHPISRKCRTDSDNVGATVEAKFGITSAQFLAGIQLSHPIARPISGWVILTVLACQVVLLQKRPPPHQSQSHLPPQGPQKLLVPPSPRAVNPATVMHGIWRFLYAP